MSKSDVSILKTILWIVVGGFVLVSVTLGSIMGRLAYLQHHPESWSPDSVGSPLWCGNSVTDLVGVILNAGTPISLAGIVGLALLANRGHARQSIVLSAAVLALGCSAGLLIFGFRYCRGQLGGFPLSEIVWWLKPFGV